MREYVLNQALSNDRGGPFPVLRRLYSNWRKRRRLTDLQQLDDRILKDIGITRADLSATLAQPMTVDPVWDIERRARLRRFDRAPGANATWMHSPRLCA